MEISVSLSEGVVVEDLGESLILLHKDKVYRVNDEGARVVRLALVGNAVREDQFPVIQSLVGAGLFRVETPAGISRRGLIAGGAGTLAGAVTLTMLPSVAVASSSTCPVVTPVAATPEDEDFLGAFSFDFGVPQPVTGEPLRSTLDWNWEFFPAGTYYFEVELFDFDTTPETTYIYSGSFVVVNDGESGSDTVVIDGDWEGRGDPTVYSDAAKRCPILVPDPNDD